MRNCSGSTWSQVWCGLPAQRAVMYHAEARLRKSESAHSEKAQATPR